MTNEEQQEVYQTLRLAEQDILRQSLEEKNNKIAGLEQRVELLEEMLNRLSTQRAAYPQPLPQPLPSYKAAPRRWTVR